MIRPEDQDQASTRKGFAGLSSLASDVKTDLADAEKEAKNGSSWTGTAGHGSDPRVSEGPSAPAASRARFQAVRSQRRLNLSAPQKWWIIAGVVFVIWMATSMANSDAPLQAIATADTSSVAPVEPLSGVTVPSAGSTPASSNEPLENPLDSLLAKDGQEEEQMPPIGTQNILNANQIRYCLSEEIRLDGAREGLNKYSTSAVDSFNAMINDYNDRCGQFRYSATTLDAVRLSVEARRAELSSQGASRF